MSKFEHDKPFLRINRGLLVTSKDACLQSFPLNSSLFQQTYTQQTPCCTGNEGILKGQTPESSSAPGDPSFEREIHAIGSDGGELSGLDLRSEEPGRNAEGVRGETKFS